MKMVYRKVLVGVFLISLLCQCNTGANQKQNQNLNENQNGNEAVVEEVEAIQNDENSLAADLPTINVKAGQILESPMKVKVNSEGKWGGFEGELGTIELFDDKNNTIGNCVLSTTENWMVNGPVNYYCDLIYNAGSSGEGRLVVRNNNPTGEAKFDKSFVIPVQYVEN